jgi:isopenicillin-N epimerase
MTGLAPLVHDKLRGGLQMVAMQLPETDVEQLKTRLYADYRIEIPVYRWKDRCILRLSIQGYNTADEADMLVRALKKLIS